MKRKQLFLWLLLAVPVLTSLACALSTVQTGATVTRSESVPAGDVAAVDVTINLGAGELDVDGGAAELLDAEFTYNVEAWDPEVEYTTSGSTGSLTISQPDSDDVALDPDIEYRWDLQLSEALPLNLAVNLGAGDANLDLTGVAITALDVDTGAGSTTIAVDGEGGLSNIDINGGAGELILDLTGEWDNDATVLINSGVGTVTVRVPDNNVGVRIAVDTGIGDVNADGFRRLNGAYVNSAFDESPATLDLNINGGVGQINLVLVE